MAPGDSTDHSKPVQWLGKMAWRHVTQVTTLTWSVARNDGIAPGDSTEHSNPGQWVGTMAWRHVTQVTTLTLVSG